MADDPKSTNGPLSLERLRSAFAQMMTPADAPTAAPLQGDAAADEAAAPVDSADESVSLHAIIEGVLFVGADEGKPRSAEELAAALRDVSPTEVDQAVDELNEQYQRDSAPYHIERSPVGYRLRLDADLGRLRDKFYGRVREARLTPAALEVLAIVAYRQPMTTTAVEQLRGTRSHALLSNLVRRGLLRIDRGEKDTSQYCTTDRFLKLFGLQDIEQLPRAAELE